MEKGAEEIRRAFEKNRRTLGKKFLFQNVIDGTVLLSFNLPCNLLFFSA